MQPTNETDYKSLFSQLIKKQILILGPDITLAKVAMVTGLTVDINGDVQKIEGDPQLLLQSLINQFVELSGMIVKKTMESILTSYPGMMAMATSLASPIVETSLGGPASTNISLGGQTSTQPTVQAITATHLNNSVDAVSQPQVTEIVGTTDISVDASLGTNPGQHIEPPAMTTVHLDSLTAPQPMVSESSKNSESFSSKEMADLNKALEDLSKTPLSTDKPVI